jgi:hypothetical protein
VQSRATNDQRTDARSGDQASASARKPLSEPCATVARLEGGDPTTGVEHVRRFIIERDLPAVGSLEREELRAAAAKSNEALSQLAPDVQWIESYVADDKTFCVYLAADEAMIRKHSELSGFPANRITEIRRSIDPTTASI